MKKLLALATLAVALIAGNIIWGPQAQAFAPNSPVGDGGSCTYDTYNGYTITVQAGYGNVYQTSYMLAYLNTWSLNPYTVGSFAPRALTCMWNSALPGYAMHIAT